MDPSLISGFAALSGAAIGGLTSAVAVWFTQREMAQSQWFTTETLRRQDIYRDFIEVASRGYIDALHHGNPGYPGLIGLYAKISRMRVLSSGEKRPNGWLRKSWIPIPSPTRALPICAIWPRAIPSISCTISAEHVASSTRPVARGHSSGEPVG